MDLRHYGTCYPVTPIDAERLKRREKRWTVALKPQQQRPHCGQDCKEN